MTTLLAPCVPVRYLDMCGKLLQRRQMEEVFEERAAAKRCAFPACKTSLPKTSGKFRVSLIRKAIYDAHYERQFCSPLCLKKARLLLSILVHKPPQLVPSLVEVFGTDKPDPFDYNDDTKLEKYGETVTAPTLKLLPMAKAVWAKTQDLGIVERNYSSANAMSGGVPPALRATASIKLKENVTPAGPERTFPTAEHGSLIEGYVFPAHKQRLANKVEKLIKKSQEEDTDGDNLAFSDSDESDAAASDVSSAGSFEISDFDDEEVITLMDLPILSHLWGLFSNWITHETTLVVARLPSLTHREESSDAFSSLKWAKKSELDHARRRAHHVHSERWNSLSLMLRRSLPQAALKLELAADRFANHRMDTITRTFELRDAIDTGNTHLWTCVATILLLVTYDIKPTDLLEGNRSDQVKQLTKLDMMELEQLLQLFYIVREDSDVAVDTDVAPIPENKADVQVKLQQEVAASKLSLNCRKCRRSKARCVCETRVLTRSKDDLSPTQLGKMLQEALALRKEHEELLLTSK